MSARIIVADRIVQGVGVAVQPLRAAIIHGIRGDEARQGRVVVAGAVVQQAAGIEFFTGVAVGRFVAAARVLQLFAEGGVGQAADLDAAGAGQDRGGVQVVGVNPGNFAIHGFGDPQAVEVVVVGGGDGVGFIARVKSDPHPRLLTGRVGVRGVAESG